MTGKPGPTSAKPVVNKYLVMEKSRLNETVFKIRFLANDIAERVLPGEFVNVRPGPTFDPLLRRPFSVYLANPEEGWIDLLIKVVGPGTELLSRLEEGDLVDILGPLGRGFDLETVGTAVLVGGGIGIAPLVFLAHELLFLKKPVHVFQGFGNAGEVCGLEDLEALKIAPVVSTEDGSFGVKGLVTDPLRDFLRKQKDPEKIELFCCGPNPMLAAISNLPDSDRWKAQFSLETRMACGIGACMGCAVPTFDGEQYRLVCKDGPVFKKNEVWL